MTKEQSIENSTGRYKEQYTIAKYEGRMCIINYTYYDYSDNDTCGYKGDVKRAHIYFSDGTGICRDYSKLIFEDINMKNIAQIDEAMNLKKVLDIKLLQDRLFSVNLKIKGIMKEKKEIISELKKHGIKK